MKETELSTPSSFEADEEKTKAKAGRAPAVVAYTSKKLLWAAFIVILFSRFIILLIDGVVLNLSPHVMSRFSESAESVLSVLPMVVGISSGILRIPMAKMIDNYGRGPGLLMAWLASDLGLMILGCANSLASTVVGQILYGIGSSLMDFIFIVILADLTSLKNRALIYGIYTTPAIFTTFAAPHMTQSTPWQEDISVCMFMLCSILGPLIVMFNSGWTMPWGPDEETDATISKQQPSSVPCSFRNLMTNSSILGGSLAVMFTAASTACWDLYYSSYLQVVNDETSITASRITNTRIVAFAVSAPFIGFLVRYTGFLIPPALLGVILLVNSTFFPLAFQGMEPHAYRNVLQLFQMGSGVGERLLIACSQIEVLVDHENAAMALGIWGTFLSIGAAMGSLIAAAIWMNKSPQKLYDALPADSKGLMAELIPSIEKVKQFPMGSPVRDAVAVVYRALEEHAVVTAEFLAALAIVFMCMWKHINMRTRNDVQGARTKGVIW